MARKASQIVVSSEHVGWSRLGVPHGGWTLLDVVDHEAPDHICEMCELAEVRYVHELSHPRYQNLFVGVSAPSG